jgi:branched-chain amino acid aminotransferase
MSKLSSAAHRSFFRKDLVVKAKLDPTSTHPPMKGVNFGTVFAPHMLEADWNIERGWSAPVIRDFGTFEMSPASSGLQYGLQCFEGMKAYRDANDNSVRVFRPDRNAARLRNSSNRLTLPTFDENEFVECLAELVRVDKNWIPTEQNHSLYIRPTMVSTTADIAVGPATDAKFFIITSPVGPYYSTGFKPVKLLVNSKAHRAWPGGTGGAKIGPNYAGPIPHQIAASQRGFGQLLWLGPKRVVDEVGAMNFMLLWNRASDGKKELITAPLDGTILPGITRDSILTLARQWGEFEVSEKRFTIDDVTQAIQEKRVLEAFGCGTAAIVTSVNGLNCDGIDYDIPLPSEDKSLAMRCMRAVVDIQTGKTPSPWAYRVC